MGHIPVNKDKMMISDYLPKEYQKVRADMAHMQRTTDDGQLTN